MKWYKNNKLYSLGTNYLITSEPGAYNAEISQGSCVVRSNTIVVKEGTIVPPVITHRYGINPSCLGQTAWLQVIYNYFGSYNSFQWQRNGIDIPGATSDEYHAAANGEYTVRVTKGSCSAVSAPKSLTFSDVITPEFIYPLYNQTKLNGVACSEYRMSSSISFSNATYQWYRDGQPIEGATNWGYTARQSGVYSFSIAGTIYGAGCGGKSRELAVQIGRADKPIITFEQVAGGICQNNIYRLAAQYDQGTLQWKRNGIVIPTGTPDYYDADNYYAYQSGIYTVVLNDGDCSTESDPVEIKIGEPTAATLTGNALVTSGQSAQLPVAFTGPAPWSFTLSNGQSVQNTYLNPYPLTVTPSVTTTYSIAAVDNACGTGMSVGQAVVTVGTGQADLSVMAQVSSRAPKVDDVVSYSLLVTNAGPQEAGNVQITNQLPAGIYFVEAVSPGISFANGIVSSNISSIGVGYTSTLVYRLRVTQPGTYFTAAQVATTNIPDPDSQPNSGTGDGQDDAVTVDLRTVDTAGTLVTSPNPNQVILPKVLGNQPAVLQGSVELGLGISSNSLSPQAGDTVSLSLIVTNRGGATANNIVVQTLLPSGWQLTNSTGFVVNGQTVKGYINQLVANGRAVLILPVQVRGGNGQIQAQILSVTEPVSNAIPGNGYQNGERDEASLMMLRMQESVIKPHPYQSTWTDWIIDRRAIWYLYEPADGAQRGVLLIGNPLTMLLGLPAMLWCAWAAWAHKRVDALAVALIYAASLG
ncbi:MAG: DUF11 domain-containing protein, partial [Cytophagaceae bacterium]